MDIIRRHLPKRINNPQTKIKPVGLLLHYIGNPGTTAAQNASYFASVQEQISVHYIVDDNEILEIIPPTMKSYGTSSKAHNESYVQIEMCHPDATGRISGKTLENTVWLCRKLIAELGLTQVIRHFDATGKHCPLWYVSNPKEWEALKEWIFPPEKPVTDLQPHWAQTYFESLNRKGVKISETRFDDPVTRGELFALMDRVVKYFKEACQKST